MKQPEQLTIGMAVYEDYDGVYFTIQALRYYHRDVMDRVKFLVIDNCPGGKHSECTRNFVENEVKGRYIATDKIKGNSIKTLIFDEADTELVLCIDSHILIEPNGVKALLKYYDDNPDSMDLIQGPLLYDDIESGTVFSHFKPGWGSGMFGQWDTDPRASDLNGEPFDIPAQGCGLFSCRKDAWLGFNPLFEGFAVEEFYIHEKFRQAGRRTLCLPALRWLHRFGRPNGVPYKNTWEDRLRNYLIGWTELGLPLDGIKEHFSTLIDPKAVRMISLIVEAEVN